MTPVDMRSHAAADGPATEAVAVEPGEEPDVVTDDEA
jgi:hypothetical protein